MMLSIIPGIKAREIKENPDSDFVMLYPGVLTEKEKPQATEWMAGHQAINNRGPVDIQALIKGKLPPNTPGIGPVLIVTKEMVLYQNGKYDPENPVLNVAEYARKTGYKDIIAFPTYAPNDNALTSPYPGNARDRLLVGDLNHNISYYKPIYPGDTLYSVINKITTYDLTPPEGAIRRNIQIITESSIFNQRGEKVNDVIFRIIENISILKEGKTIIEGNVPMPGWESPAWTSRPVHYYTDADWAKIKDIWSGEKRQGPTPLYWEDVKVGTYPAWTADGPIMDSTSPTLLDGMGIGGSRTLKKEVMDPEIFKTLIRDERTGIYTTADRDGYIPVVPGNQSATGMAGTDAAKNEPSGGDSPDASDETNIANIHKADADSRAVLINYMCRDMAIRHINNWMGDKGWIYNIRWSIMAPSALAEVGKIIPSSPFSERYVEKVPALKGKTVNAHPLMNDLIIIKSYICNKFVRNGEFLVDLVWWAETLDGYIVEEGGATVKLPSKDI